MIDKDKQNALLIGGSTVAGGALGAWAGAKLGAIYGLRLGPWGVIAGSVLGTFAGATLITVFKTGVRS